MTPGHAYDDPHADHRRWERLDPEARHAAAERDPVLFIADHVSSADRRAGSVACLATVVERIGEDRVAELGVVHHRPGRPHITELDRRWQQALDDVCHYCGVEAVGVLARTESGAIVRPTAPRIAP